MFDPPVEQPNVMYNLCHHKFDDVCEETVPARWLIKQDMEVYQQGLKKNTYHDMMNASVVAETMWDSGRTKLSINQERSCWS